MKYLLYACIFLALITAVLFYGGVFTREKIQGNDNQETNESTQAVQPSFETKTDEQPPVSIAVTPLELGKDSQTWKFQITFDTHVGSLDQDPIESTVLIDSAGTTYKPVAWEGPGPGGHHREGILTFEAVSPMPSSVELKIKNVGGILERSFKWDIE